MRRPQVVRLAHGAVSLWPARTATVRRTNRAGGKNGRLVRCRGPRPQGAGIPLAAQLALDSPAGVAVLQRLVVGTQVGGGRRQRSFHVYLLPAASPGRRVRRNAAVPQLQDAPRDHRRGQGSRPEAEEVLQHPARRPQGRRQTVLRARQLGEKPADRGPFVAGHPARPPAEQQARVEGFDRLGAGPVGPHRPRPQPVAAGRVAL